MNIVNVGPTLVEQGVGGLDLDSVLDGGVFVIAPPELIIDAEHAASLPIDTAAHWRQLAFHAGQLGIDGMPETQAAIHRDEVIGHVGAVGLLEQPEQSSVRSLFSNVMSYVLRATTVVREVSEKVRGQPPLALGR